MKPSDLLSLSQIADMAGVSLLTARKWTYRHKDFPPPWREGQPGEPNLYLAWDVARWLSDTGRL